MISRQFRFFLLFTFLFTTALVVVLQYNANKNIDALVEGNESLLTEFQMKASLQDLQNELLSIDNIVKNSIIINNGSLEHGIKTKAAAVRNSVQKLGDLLVTDSSRKLWNELHTLTEKKIDFSYRVLDTLSASGRQAAEKLLNEQRGSQLSEDIERISTQLDEVRQNYLTQIIKTTDANSLKAKRLGLIMGIIAVVVIMFTFWYIINRIRKQQEMIFQLNESERKVREAAKIKEHFISNMSHEIRTPMNAIIGYINLLQKQSLDPKPRQYVQYIQSSSENLLLIINDVLDLSKMESGMMRIEKTPFRITEVLGSMNDLFASKAREKNLRFTIRVSADMPPVLVGDSVRISQILVNLVNNAIKFTDAGFVSVSVEPKDITTQNLLLVLRVTDSGIGIAKNQQEQVFERFTQAEENTTRRFGGTGLGLSIVKQVVQLLQGTISLESEPGKGSTFTVEIPVEVAMEPPGLEVNKPEAKVERLREHHLQLLVVEDNPMNQTLMQHLLTEWQMSFDIASNGEKAIEALKKKNYDLILMDIQMPGMDGYTTTDYIRTRLKLQLPIIAMTAHAFAGEREKCMKYGMNDYLPKPVREHDLYRMITTYVNLKIAFKTPSKKTSQSIPGINFSTIDLSYLQELSGGNKQFEREMTEQFVRQVPEELDTLRKTFDQKNWIELQRTAHNLKTSIAFLGLSPILDNDLEMLEKNTGSQVEKNTFAPNLDKVITVCTVALEEAQSLISALE